MIFGAAARDVLELLLATSGLYSVAIVGVALRFRRTRGAPAPGLRATPGVSILVPLAGVEPGLAENLAAYCRQQYPGPVEVIVGSLDAADGALIIARDVSRRHPNAALRVVAGAPGGGPNRKAVLLARLSRSARHPVVIAVDSDVRVGPDYLTRVVGALEQPSVGLVSCYYRAPRARSLAHAFEALCINTDFVPAVMLANALGRADMAFGASLVLRRETLDAVGGFTALEDHLADDHRLAELVLAHGQRVVIASYVVESDPNPADLPAAVRHQLRWARTTRACAPVGYAANIVTHGTTFALLGALPIGHASALRLGAAAAVVLLRLAAAVAGGRALGARLDWTLCLVPLRDLIATGVWVASFIGDGVEWRGRSYRLARDGRLIPLVAPARQVTPAAALAVPEERDPPLRADARGG